MTSPRSRVLARGSLLLALLALPLPALADATPEDRASADQLYNDAAKLMTAGKYAEACPKLGASQRLDPAIGTLLKLGFCFNYTGQTASAWASFNDAEAMALKAGDKSRAAQAAKQARDLEGKLSRLVIESAAPEVEVRRDGALVDRSVLGAALPVDPGAHTITASAPGKEPWSSAITVAAGPGTTTVRVPALALAPVAAPEPAKAAPVVVADPAPKAAEGWSTQRKVALGVGGAGVVGVVIGAVFGAMTLSKTSAAKGHCSADDPPQCDPEGLTLYGDAKTTANVSNVAMGVGGAAVIGGVVLFFDGACGGAPKAEMGARVKMKVLPVVGLGSTGVLLQGGLVIMRGLGVMVGAVAGFVALAGGCQLIAGVKDAEPYPDAGTGGGGQGGGVSMCTPGTMVACPYSGPKGTEGVGSARRGQLCSTNGMGDGACSGEVTPKAESCAAAEDENCDGYDCVQWAELFGDTGEQLATSIAVDAMGNSFVGGYFSGVIPFGANNIKSMGTTDGFLLKFDPAGTPLWGLSFGDANDPQSVDCVATDADGNVVITGFSFSPFSIANAMLPKGPFVAKFDKDGKYIWSKGLVQIPCTIGSPGAARLAVTPQNDIIIAGSFCGTMDFGNGSLASQGTNTANGFIIRLQGKDGSGKTGDGGWARTFGDGMNPQHALDVAVSPTGTIVVVGDFKGSLTLDATYASKGSSDIFVAQLTPEGASTWTAALGGADDDSGVRIAVDKFGGPLILGSFANSISLEGSVISSTGGAENGLIVKIATDKFIEWYKQIPVGSPFSAAIDGDDNILLTGIFIGSLDLGAGPLNTTGSNIDLFLAKLTKGGSVVWNKRFDGSSKPLSILGAVAVNKANEPIMAGGSVIPIDFGTGLMTPLSNADGFLVKLSP